MNNLELFKRNALSASATIIVFTQKYLIDGKVDLQGVADMASYKASERFSAELMEPCNITVSPGITDGDRQSVRVYAESNRLNLEPLDNEDDRLAWKLIVASIMTRIADEISGLHCTIFYSDGTSCTAEDYDRFMELSK